jgi:hypothetical protein
MPEVIILPVFFSMLAFIVWTIVNAWQRRQHLKLITDFNSRLLERIGSVKDFSDFLQTPGGTQFLDSLTVDRGSIGPRERILRAAQTGIVIGSVGAGCFFLTAYLRSTAPDAAQVFAIVSAIFLSLGVGFVVAAAASYALARRLGALR